MVELTEYCYVLESWNGTCGGVDMHNVLFHRAGTGLVVELTEYCSVLESVNGTCGRVD